MTDDFTISVSVPICDTCENKRDFDMVSVFIQTYVYDFLHYEWKISNEILNKFTIYANFDENSKILLENKFRFNFIFSVFLQKHTQIQEQIFEYFKRQFGEDVVLEYGNYSEYLKSEHWQKTRKRALSRAKYKCQLCGNKNEKLNVHHNTYENLGNEKNEDLIVLCESCHSKFHDK